jgi:hypothetical protein
MSLWGSAPMSPSSTAGGNLGRYSSQAWPVRRYSMSSSGGGGHSLGSLCALAPSLGQRLNAGGRASSLGVQSISAAAAAVAAAELEQQQWQCAGVLGSPGWDSAASCSCSGAATAAAGKNEHQRGDSVFAAEAADAFAYTPVSFAARGRSVSLRQSELSRHSMPLPALARNRSMGSIALPSPPPAAAGSAGTSSLARRSAGLARSSASFSRCSSSATGRPLEQQLQRTSWLPRQGTGLFQGSPGR